MADYASTVKEFMDSMGIPKASLVGRATGACIAAELAVLYPDRADKLVFFGGPNYGISLRQARINTDDPAFRPVELKWDGSHVMTAWRAVATQAEANRQNTVDPGVTIEDVQMMFSNRMLAGKWAEDAHNAVWTYAVEKRLPLIQSHTLLLVGDRDFSYDQREETRALIPHCRIKVIPRGDLFTELTRSAEVAEAIIQFIGNPGV
jgi:pimeloyl-ACP methyl ester carboxylesterase